MKSQSHYLRIVNETQRTVLCPHASLADTSMTRLFGLLGRPPLTLGEGLLIKPSSGVHTCGMSFPIDIAAIGSEDRVVGLWRAVGAWRLRGLNFQTRSVLELAPGAIDGSNTAVGDQLRLTRIERTAAQG